MLKQLQLIGFKSFADKTAFDFSTGITGVVGPNGSGKSNVVDSIKWILGDQSASSLRGKSMSDVIFNGSSTRAGSPFAEATLTFDNASGFLPDDRPEVSVGRRLWRSGESEYLINGVVARLKDVRNLFMGTGAGASSYCIIEQGRVAQILQANASTRRLVFEEAAGISRYQSRRAEALRKLDRVEQHVARLTDIVDEAESRLSAVRSQAARAARFREVRAEFRELWVGLAADEYRRLASRRSLLTARIEELNSAMAVITTDQGQLESERVQTEKVLSEAEDRLRQSERDRNELLSQIASLQTTLVHEHARHHELDSEIERLRNQAALLKSRSDEASRELARTERVLENENKSVGELRLELDRAEQRYADYEARLNDSRTTLEDDRSALILRMQENSSLESQLRAAQGSLRQGTEDTESLIAERERVRQKQSGCEAELRRMEADVETLESELAAADGGVRQIRDQRQELQSRRSEIDAEIGTLREKRSAWEARLSVLEDLETRQEGLRVGTREILKRARKAEHEPWKSILGSVTDLLEVDLDKAALLDVALADRAQLIVIQRIEPLVEYLNSGRSRMAGRVGFLSLESIRSRTAEVLSIGGEQGRPNVDKLPSSETLPDLSGLEGVVEPAAAMARSSEPAADLMACLLGDTWVVETLNDALRLGQAHRRCRFVTLQGELLENDGTLFAGLERSEAAVLSRRSELRRLKQDLQRASREIEVRQQQCDQLSEAVSGADDQLDTALQNSRVHSERLAELKAARGQITAEQNRLMRKQADIDSRERILSERASGFQADLASAEELLQAGVASLATLRERLAESEGALTDSRRLLESLTAERNQAELALGKQEERFSGLREGIDRLRSDLHQRELQEQEADRRVNVAVRRRREIAFRILETNSRLAGLHLTAEEFARDGRGHAREHQRMKASRSSVAARESELSEQRRELATELHGLEMELGTLTHQVDSTRARIEDEFQFSLDEAVRSGASAMAAHVLPVTEASDLLIEESTRLQDDTAHAVATESDEPDPEDLPASEPSRLDRGLDEQWSHDVECVDERPDNDTAAVRLAAVAKMDDDEFDRLREELEERVERLRRRLRNMGNVSTESLENLEELEGRFGGLSEQLQDLMQARDTLEAIVRRINVESKRMFAETFECIRGHFRDLFRKLFGGGEGDVILEDPDDVLECGIDIVARPPGKELRSITLLSGGEKTMTAVALLMAIFRSRPSPFCILDEVDAALDEANVDRFVGVLREFQETTQFIMITHRKPSMSVCDLIFGVTMEESGVSKRLTVRFEDVDENGDFVVSENRDAA